MSKYTLTHGTYVEEVDKEALPNLSVGFYEIYSIEEYLYDYDDNANITRVRLRTVDADGDETLTELNSYIYDNVNQLVRENNAEKNKTFVYVYDKGGNIAQKKEYAYSTGELGEAVSIINYSYDNTWKDKLTAYGDTQIQTDEMGNPLNYSSISINDVEVSGTLEWNGRQLAAVNVGRERFEYSYDANGLRSSVKYYSSGGELARTYYYIWQNGKLVGYYVEEASGNNGTSVKMLFDEKGEPIGYMAIETGDEEDYECFWFRKNLQGDITAVCKQNGSYVMTYTYDAWGKVECTAQSDDISDILIALLFTPITYRGYNYDVFTGLYYLQSRYYNPTYGRFLNADTTEILEATQGTPHGANLFAYCNNNPVNMTDISGMNPAIVAGGLKFLFEFLSVIVFVLILVYSITYATTGTIGNAESKYYSPEAFLRALNQMYETIKRYEELLRTALYTAAILAFVKGLDGCNNHDHHIIAQTSPKAQTARDYFTSKDVGGKITDPDNIIGVKNVFHYFLHTDIYYIAINALIVESYYFHGELSRRESVYSMLGVIKQTIAFFDAAVPLG